MNIKQLESFVTIIERGSFAAAADSLLTTQSTISARIQELERHFGVPLFDRTRHRARLTPKGEELLPYARQVVQLSQQATERISDPQSIAGVLRVGVVGLIAMTVLPRLVTEIRTRYPNVTLRLEAYLTRVLFEKLDDGELDMAFVTAPVTEPDLASVSIGFDDFVWLASPALGLPDGPLSPKDLERWPVLGFPPESHHYPVIHKWFNDNGAFYTPTISCNNMAILADLTAAGAGLALLPRSCYQPMIDDGRLRIVNTAPPIPQVEFVAVYKRDVLAHPLVDTVANLAAELGNRQGLLDGQGGQGGSGGA